MAKISFKFILSFFLLFVAMGFVQTKDSHALQREILYGVGDQIQVKFHNEWFDAEVTELLGGGRMLRAKFTDSRGKNRVWMFASSQIRDGESSTPFGDRPTTDDGPEEDSSPTYEMRTWNSADEKFSVEAKFVDFDGEKVELLKRGDLTIKVPLTTFSKKDVDYVNKIEADKKEKKSENPFKAENPFAASDPDDPFAPKPKKRAKEPATPKQPEPATPDRSESKKAEPDPFNIKKDPRKPRISHPPFHKPKPKKDPNESTFGEEVTFGDSDFSSNSSNASKPLSNEVSNKKAKTESARNDSKSTRDPNFPIPKVKAKVGSGMSPFIRMGIFLTSLLFGTISVIWGFANRKKYK